MYSPQDIAAIIAAAGGLPPGRVEFFASHYIREPDGTLIQTQRNQPWMVRRRLALRHDLMVMANYKKVRAKIPGLLKSRRPSGKKSHGGARRIPNFVMDGWLLDLGEVYEEIFEKEPTFSNNYGQVNGSFVRYLDACLRPILGEATDTPNALYCRWRRALKRRYLEDEGFRRECEALRVQAIAANPSPADMPSGKF